MQLLELPVTLTGVSAVDSELRSIQRLTREVNEQLRHIDTNAHDGISVPGFSEIIQDLNTKFKEVQDLRDDLTTHVNDLKVGVNEEVKAAKAAIEGLDELKQTILRVLGRE